MLAKTAIKIVVISLSLISMSSCLLNTANIKPSPDEYSNLIVEPDRNQAIKHGIEALRDDEILMILGKGHEEFQEINGTKIPFNDQKVVEEMLSNLFRAQTISESILV